MSKKASDWVTHDCNELNLSTHNKEYLTQVLEKAMYQARTEAFEQAVHIYKNSGDYFEICIKSAKIT